MKNTLQLLTALLLLGFSAQSQNTRNTTQLGHLSYNQGISEVRGALHNGREYALVGVQNGFSIVDVTDASSPTQVFFEPGPNSTWRDSFYYNGYAYCVTEGGEGVLIVDMSPLPGSTALSTTLYTGSTYDISSVHDIFIDAENERAYLFGSNDVDGAIILDVSNPASPVELGIWDDFYIHDGFVRGDTLWAACLSDGAFIVDVSNPSNPIVLANWDTPSEFTHNIWPSDDSQLCFTTDEVGSGHIAAYDISDLQNVQETDKVQHPLSEGVIPHNTHFINDYLVTSHYRDGMTIHDVSDPNNIVLTGYFDSSPLSGGGFNGAWGTWPFLPSGNILIADIEEGLYIVGPTYVRAARLEGTVTEFGSGNPLNGVQIEVASIGLIENSSLFGDYATGTEEAGTYSVTFQKGGYLPQTINNVVLVNGQTITVDVELVPDVPFMLTGLITEAGTGTPIEGATVQFTNEFFDIELSSDGSGNYVDNAFFEGEYEVVVAAWGYVAECATITITASGISPSFELDLGYHDDFVVDLGWSVSGSASAGVWERGFPVETGFQNSISNPGTDVLGDCGGQAFVTGNGGGSAGTDDVDDGVTILRSPIMDLSAYTNPIIEFEYWFFNAGGDGSPNDQYVVKIDNGTSVATLNSLPTSGSQWTPYISDFIAAQVQLTSTMQLVIEVADADPGHLVEGGLDKFRIEEATAINEQIASVLISVYPNPANKFVNVVVGSNMETGYVQIWDVTGKAVTNQTAISNGINRVSLPEAAGVYLCEVLIDGQRSIHRLLVY